MRRAGNPSWGACRSGALSAGTWNGRGVFGANASLTSSKEKHLMNILETSHLTGVQETHGCHAQVLHFGSRVKHKFWMGWTLALELKYKQTITTIDLSISPHRPKTAAGNYREARINL